MIKFKDYEKRPCMIVSQLNRRKKTIIFEVIFLCFIFLGGYLSLGGTVPFIADGEVYADTLKDNGFPTLPRDDSILKIPKLMIENGDGEYLKESNVLILTHKNKENSVSSIVSKVKIDLDKPFETSFYVFLGNYVKGRTSLSDGAAFFLTSSEKGSNYIGKGQSQIGTYTFKIKNNPLVALEFDTYYNTGLVAATDSDVNTWGGASNGGSDNGHIAIRYQDKNGEISKHLGAQYGTDKNPLAMVSGTWLM